ncbi:hypothetical protein [Methylococcus sp. EFPC2]|uniref:hypothetical protein n=1 Tax=Methylococcus sp. EFPC2 TaxID=2812648 RepID=UPI001967EE9E|nr:hypothetical protein [Methylococcus sp. EFPC2]QSA96362.1 hypothetical protein JWZ97_14215 [Methylococcus sp. EFPC2]
MKNYRRLILASILVAPLLAYAVYSEFAGHERSPVSLASAGAASPEPRKAINKSSAAQGDSDNFERLSRELSKLKGELTEMRRISQLQANAARGYMSEPEAQDKRLADDAYKAEQERLNEERVAHIETNFRIEKSDPEWAPKTASTLQDALRQNHLDQGLAQGIDCRSQTCRVELNGDNSTGDHMKSIMRFIHEVGSEMPNMDADQRIDESGNMHTVLYLSNAAETGSSGGK